MPDRKWQEVAAPPESLSDNTNAVLGRLEPLRKAWEEAASADPAEFEQARLRALRRHAIETGIIERLYDVSWGVTEALVADGLALSVAEREGPLEGNAFEIIKAQYDALEFVVAAATEMRPALTVQFVRELHVLITKHQATYEATDSLGRRVEAVLRHGEWKTESNHVVRPDGSKFEYAPPERVQDQVEKLIEIANQHPQLHPIVRAAWLHHNFIGIHPFQDGNGRVARALVLLELLRGRFAPIVVDRHHRDAYISVLDDANDGDLEPLIRFLAELERQAMVRQFQAPIQTSEGAGVLEVARQASAKLADLQAAVRTERAASLHRVISDLHRRLSDYLNQLRGELETTFRANDRGARVRIQQAVPGAARAGYWGGALVKLANRHDFYANLKDGSWWVTLDISMLGERMRYLAALVKVGAGETGIANVVVLAERELREADQRRWEWLIEPAPRDAISVTYEQSAEEVWDEVAALVERSLAAAIAEHVRMLA